MGIAGLKPFSHCAKARLESPDTACGSKEAPVGAAFFGMTESHAPSLFGAGGGSAGPMGMTGLKPVAVMELLTRLFRHGAK
jgi:hypothetical protein